jgi:Na+/citrate or Na+/malate symporter
MKEQNKVGEMEGKQTREGEIVKGADALSISISAPDNIRKEIKKETKTFLNDTIIFLAGVIWGLLAKLPITVEQYIFYTVFVLIITYFMYIRIPIKKYLKTRRNYVLEVRGVKHE